MSPSTSKTVTLHSPIIHQEIVQNDWSRDGITGSVASGERVEWPEYGRGSIRGHKDNRKHGAVAPKAVRGMMSSICSRIRCKFPNMVSILGRKNICSPTVSPVD